MADEETTENQVPTPGSMQDTQWQPDFKEEDLVVPYKREDKDETAEDAEGEDAGAEGESEDDGGEEQVAEPSPVVTAQNPGEYQPKDYSFEIEIDGKTHTVDSPQKAEQLGEEYADKLTAKQLFALISKGSKIDLKQERDKEEYDKLKTTYDAQVQTEAQRQDTVNGIASEFDYLVSKNLLPAVSKENQEANWSDPEIAKQPGVKEQLELLAYMTRENAIRVKAGVKPMTSIVDAYNAWSLDATRQKRVVANKAAGEARKAAGSRVAGVAPTQSAPYVPQGIAVGRTGVFDRGNVDWT